MPVSFAAAYVGRPVAADPGYRLALRSIDAQVVDEGPDVERTVPWTIALSEDGRTIAFLESGASGDRIVVARDGHRQVVPKPPRFPLRRYGYQGFPQVVSRLRLTRDGTLFATLTSYLYGGYIGNREETFVYEGNMWHAIAHPEPVSCMACPDNVTIGAAQTPEHYALTSDFRGFHPVSPMMFRSDPTFFVSHSAIVDGKRVEPLGFGDVLALAGRFAAGYVDSFGHSPGQRALMATRWTGTNRTSLGPGVAFDVAPDGAVVGDDRTYWEGLGRPTLWVGRHATTLVNAEGSAFAIRDDVIVGSGEGSAFVLSRTHHRRAKVAADRRDLRIATAFAIASNGHIFGLGRYVNGDVTVVVLTPASDKSR